jgi:hypothetical protein
MRTILYVVGILMLLFGLNACSDTKTENTTKTDSVKLNHRPVPKEAAGPIDYTFLDTAVSDNIIKLDSIYGHTPYYIKIEGTYLFYVCAKKLEYGDKGKFNVTDILLGIADNTCKEILKPEYTKIYNPDATAVGYIEIEKNGKRGLFNYKTNEIIPPTFDVIFPSDQPDIDAFGKKGDSYAAITNGSVVPFQGDIPTYISYWQKWEFNIKNKSVKHLLDSYSMYYSEDPEEGQGVLFTPSYFFDLGFLPEVVTGIDESGKAHFGTIENNGKLIEEYSITDKIAAFIASFYEEGVDGRGWQIDNQSLVTVDKSNNVLGQKTILEYSDWNMTQLCPKGGRGYRLLQDDIVEVYDVLSSKENELYDYMTTYSYYKIDKGGKIKELDGVRTFDFTKYVKMNESHLTGHFYKYRIGEKYESGDNMWASEHLSIDDLDLMRNEIYAEYGLIFKSLKWQEYFSKKSWYKPQFENVDSKLSEIDKANIKLIISTKEKMSGNELKFTNRRGFAFHMAG